MPKIAIATYICGAVSVSSAQPFIEIGAVGSSSYNDTHTYCEIRAVIDASAPPLYTASDVIVFPVVWAEYHDASLTANSEPMGPTDVSGADLVLKKGTSAEFNYLPEFDQYMIVINDASQVPTLTTTLAIESPRGQFSFFMESLPDDPDDYLIVPDSTRTSVQFRQNRTSFQASWFRPTNSFSGRGHVRAWAKETQDPNLDTCYLDLTKDGILDFFDVARYIDLFLAGCP